MKCATKGALSPPCYSRESLGPVHHRIDTSAIFWCFSKTRRSVRDSASMKMNLFAPDLISQSKAGSAFESLCLALALSGNVLAVQAAQAPPLINGFSPNHGPVDTQVTVQGDNLADVSAVSFAGVAAEFQ